jgi:nickel transport protein
MAGAIMTSRFASRMLAAGLVLSSAPALAHDFWLEKQASTFLLRYGHRGAETLPLDAAKMRSLTCRKDKGAAENLLGSAQVSPTQLSLTAPCSVLSAFFDGGFYSLTPDGEKNLPKNKVPDAVKSWRSKQFAKWIDVRSPLAAQAQGDEFEIVPMSDLSKVKTGDKATFRVLLGGKPVSGAVLSIGHKALGDTDDHGEVRVKVRASDVESVSASYRRVIQSTDADSEVFEASLTFEVAK